MIFFKHILILVLFILFAPLQSVIAEDSLDDEIAQMEKMLQQKKNEKHKKEEREKRQKEEKQNEILELERKLFLLKKEAKIDEEQIGINEVMYLKKRNEELEKKVKEYKEEYDRSYFQKPYTHNVYATFGIGTAGLNFGFGYYFNNFLGLRAEFSFFPPSFMKPLENLLSASYGTDAGGYEIDGYYIDENLAKSTSSVSSKFNFKSFGMDFSVRPLHGIWRLDVGFRYVDIYAILKIQEAVSIINAYTGTITGTIKVTVGHGIKPYFGTGWDFNINKYVKISLSAGIIYTIDKWQFATNADVQHDTSKLTNDAKQTLDQKKINKTYFELNEYGEMIPKSGEPISVWDLIQKITGETTNAAVQISNDWAKEHIADSLNTSVANWLRFWPEVKLNITGTFDLGKLL